MRTVIFDIEPLSLNDLKEKYPKLIHNDWFTDQDFAKEKAIPGKYEIGLEAVEGSFSKTYDEQKNLLPAGYEIPTVAVLMQAMMKHYKATGKRLFEDYYVRTSTLECVGGLVDVGFFGASGANVDSSRTDRSYGFLGVSLSRRVYTLSFDLRPFDSVEITEVRINGKRFKLVEEEE